MQKPFSKSSLFSQLDASHDSSPIQRIGLIDKYLLTTHAAAEVYSVKVTFLWQNYNCCLALYTAKALRRLLMTSRLPMSSAVATCRRLAQVLSLSEPSPRVHTRIRNEE
jgi:hypothetical protein